MVVGMTKQIPPGYKQTKIGIIPEDWEVVTINHLVNIDYLDKPLDGNHGNIHPKSSDFVSNGIPFIMANNIRNGVLDLENCAFIAKNQADQLQKGFSIAGDILLTHKGTVGNVAMVKHLYTEYIMLTPQVTYYRVKNQSQLSSYYVLQYFLSKNFQQKLQEIAGGGTRAYIGITEQRNLPFIFPPFKEQEKIAEILSTWDDAISKQEQLIEQKQVFKKGIMQQIFSQKIRLKDDNGNDYPDWKKYKLTKVAKTSIGLVTTMTTSYVENNGTPLIRNSDILPNKIKDDLIQLSNLFANQYNSRKLRHLDVVTVHTGDVGISAVINEKLDGCHGFATLNTRVDQKILNPFYLSYYFNSYSYISYAIKMSTGDGRCNFNLKDFDNSIIPTPALNEQARIVDFLSTIDNGISKQTEVLDQLKLQKQSLMQKLLTGQVRVINKGK